MPNVGEEGVTAIYDDKEKITKINILSLDFTVKTLRSNGAFK
jgi:hypothetical protein